MTITFTQLGNNGRLANQLFQLSCCISYAMDHKHQYRFPLWKYEPYFNLHGCFSNDVTYNIAYQEPHFHHVDIPTFRNDENVDFRGYWQSYKYFINNQDVIFGLLTPKNGCSKKWNTTSVHVRRGDYLNFQDCHPVHDMIYYQKAMHLIKSKYYLIVSDDIPWCKKNFIGEQFSFSEADEITDLSLQINCEHNIIANSSFSWWGAYLNKNPSKIVIAPERWFGPKLPHNTKDLYPANWIRI